MATVGTNNLTLMDVARRTDPDGKVPAIVELLEETNEMLDDMSWIEANDGSNHVTTVRTGLPTNTWRKLYKGIAQTKSTTKQVSDSTGMLESLAITDTLVIDNAPDPAGMRLSEEFPFLESLSQDIQNTLIYGDVLTNPDRFTGLTERYNYYFSGSGDDTLSSYNVFDATDTNSGGDNTSIWLVGWGPRAVHGLYPQGSKAGIDAEDWGRDLVQDANNDYFPAYRTQYKWHAGLTVRDWRAAGRICNIDLSNLEANGATAAGLINLMIRLSERCHLNGTRPAWYMHERVRTFLRIQMLENNNTNVTFETVEGKKVMMFDGIPVRQCDQISTAETAVVVQP